MSDEEVRNGVARAIYMTHWSLPDDSYTGLERRIPPTWENASPPSKIGYSHKLTRRSLTYGASPMSSNQLVDEVANFPRNHNAPPLSERLAEDVAPLAARLKELADVASTCVINSDEACAKTVDLIGLSRAHLEAVTRRHAEEAAPYKLALEQIDNAYRPIERSLTAIIGTNAREGLRGAVTVWERKRQEAAEAERQRLIAEQRQRDAEAEAARRALEEKKAGGSAGVADELAVLQAEDAAARLGQRAEAVRPAPVRANMGTVGSARQIVCEITDLRKACGWLLKSPMMPTLTEVVQQMMARYLRNLGVSQVERGVSIPGVEARIERVAQVR